MKFAVLCLIGMVALASSANAVSVKAFRTAKQAGGSEWMTLKLYVDGVAKGYWYANADLLAHHKEPLFCPNDKLPVNADNFLAILENLMEKRKSAIPGDMEIELILITGIKDAFPCAP